MKIAVVGSYGVGMTMRFAKFPEAGETLMGGAFDAGPGGKGSNQAIGAARLLELPLLTEEEREIAVEISMEAGAAFLKNASSGQIETANPESIKYLVDRVKDGVKVKASGSIKSFAQAKSLIAAGASLLGTSAGIEIISDTSTSFTKSY